MKKFRSNGKLLITGEYVVLDGALALAVPTKFGQSLEVETVNEEIIHWIAYDYLAKVWFEYRFQIKKIIGEIQKTENSTLKESQEIEEVSSRLFQILQQVHLLNPEILTTGKGYKVATRLEFPSNWGLGSSSTLLNNIAQWFKTDAFLLLEKTFGGSGYDIAAAQNNHAFTYQTGQNNRSVLTACFNPIFKENLFFVHLNRKQNSRASITHYKQQPKEFLEETVAKISALTSRFISCESLEEFNLLIEIHETLISKIVNTPKIKSELFPDYPGAIKSLGGWGGDFILATGGESEKNYFEKKGFKTIISYSNMIL
ncbi:MAG: GHMP kinase [Flavobacteriaceae bacterium]|nr:GHMP kinase [Flavobacteriaceae bacterium]